MFIEQISNKYLAPGYHHTNMALYKEFVKMVDHKILFEDCIIGGLNTLEAKTSLEKTGIIDAGFL